LISSGRTPQGFHDLLESTGDEDFTGLTARLAKEVVSRQLTVPVIIFLESVKPLSFLGNQLLIFANPVVSLLVSSPDYYGFVRMLEDRENVEKLILAIEEENAREAARKRDAKAAKRSGGRGFLGRLRRSGGTSGTQEKEVDGGDRQGDHQDPGD